MIWHVHFPEGMQYGETTWIIWQFYLPMDLLSVQLTGSTDIYIYYRVISHLTRVDIGLRSKPYEKPHFTIEQEWITTPMLVPYFQSTGQCEFQAESQSGMLPSPNWRRLIFQRLLSMIKNWHWRSDKEGLISIQMSSCKHNKDLSCLQ